MNLIKNTDARARATHVPCIGKNHALNNANRDRPRVGIMFPLAEGYADLDGPAYRAYYCDDCAADLILGRA